MTQKNPTFGEPVAERGAAAAALSLPISALADTSLPVQVVSCGVPFLFVPIATRSAVDQASANRAALDALLRSTAGGAHGVFFFTPESGADGATAYSRMFAPALGVDEDPATGIASGPLGCYLVHHNVISPTKAGAMWSLQGVRMGRPSHVHISIRVENGDITLVQVGGEAVLAGEGTLYL
jgi:trans-2,3-dihydro-3-hydroxyanthranilate isomerase